MPLIDKPTRVTAMGEPPKTIEEFVGRVNTQTEGVSVARMKSPKGWSEPGQTPEFDEWSLVLSGTLRVETKAGVVEVAESQSYFAPKNTWVRYSTPEGPADYVAVCIPAFSPPTVHRDT